MFVVEMRRVAANRRLHIRASRYLKERGVREPLQATEEFKRGGGFKIKET